MKTVYTNVYIRDPEDAEYDDCLLSLGLSFDTEKEAILAGKADEGFIATIALEVSTRKVKVI